MATTATERDLRHRTGLWSWPRGVVATRARIRSLAPWSSRAGAKSVRVSTRPQAFLTPSARRWPTARKIRRAGRCTSRSSPAPTMAGRRRAPTRSWRRGSRVVIASDDPTPKASGRGCGILRDEGVEIQLVDGEVAREARLLNQPFRKHARSGRPLVVFKSAMTLDGKVATRTGDSRWISGEMSRARAHRWRSEADAVAVGDRHRPGRRPAAHRAHRGRPEAAEVIFDSEARLPLDSALVRGAARCRPSSSARGPPSAPPCRRSRPPASTGSWPRARTRRRGWSRRSTSWAPGRSSRSCSRAVPTWRARSSRRGDRRGAHLRGAHAGRRPRGPDRAGGPGDRGDRGRPARATPRSSGSTTTCS